MQALCDPDDVVGASRIDAQCESGRVQTHRAPASPRIRSLAPVPRPPSASCPARHLQHAAAARPSARVPCYYMIHTDCCA